MKSFLVALALVAVASAQTCDYPHKGNGGVLGPNGQYILGKNRTADCHTAKVDVQSS